MADLGLHSAKSVNPLDIADHEINIEAVLSNAISLDGVGTSLTSQQKYHILERLNFSGLASLENLPISASFLIEKIERLDEDHAVKILRAALIEHEDDVNIPHTDLHFYQKLVDRFEPEEESHKAKLGKTLDGNKSEAYVETIDKDSSSALDVNSFEERKIVDWDLQVRLEATIIAYWSPYPEVRAVTDPFDDPNIPCETLRVYFLGAIWTVIGVFINQFFAGRFPSIGLTSSVVQLFLYPCGRLMEYITPKWTLKIWKYKFELNPGPWNYKEQMLTTIFFGVAGGTSYVASNIQVQKMDLFYGAKWVDFGYQVLLILSSNFMGIGYAGIMRKFSVYPATSVWPTLLPTLALNRALLQPEKKETINGWTISRFKFFFTVFGASFVYFWFPNYIFQALSTFNWISWIKPTNLNLAVVTGLIGGLGLNPIPSFDWNIIHNVNPLYIPFFSQMNALVGAVLAFFTILGVFYKNMYWSAYLPINTPTIKNNLGKSYQVRKILDKAGNLHTKKYEEYGPPFYSAANLVIYGSFFAIYPFLIVYEVGAHYKTMQKAFVAIWKGIRHRQSTYEGFNDPHSRMMAAYKEVPDYAFLIILVISIVLAILCIKLYPTDTPVWSIFFVVGIGLVFLVPLNILQSVTGTGLALNVLVELVSGYAIPGNGQALMFIKALGVNIDAQALNYITDQKMGHYAKLPPRAMFRIQILSIFVGSFMGLAIINFQMSHIPNYCQPDNRQKFTCPSLYTFYSSSIFWGVVGPKRVFGGLYPLLKWCFLMGFLFALPCLAFRKLGPRKYRNYFQPTVVITGFINWAPLNLSYIIGGVYVSIAFMYYIRRRYVAWWQKYNYILNGGLQAGIAFSGIIMFFAVQYHDKSINWWGNTVSYSGYDGAMVGRLSPKEAPEGYFGPRKGHFP